MATPALLGTQEAIRQSQQKERKEEHRARRCNLIAKCIRSSVRSFEINGRPLVLRNGEIFVDTGSNDGSSSGHQYAGYYLPYPDKDYEGLVTTVTDVAPVMNWVYVDRQTYRLKYGVRKDAEPNITGKFDCTRQSHRLTLMDWEGFCAVEVCPGIWGVYFDVNDDGLAGKVPAGTRVLEIELERCEKRWKKEALARAQDQTTKRENVNVPEPQEAIKDPAIPAKPITHIQADAKSKNDDDEEARAIRLVDSATSNGLIHPPVQSPSPLPSPPPSPPLSPSPLQVKHPETAPPKYESTLHVNAEPNVENSPHPQAVVRVEPPVILQSFKLRPKQQSQNRSIGQYYQNARVREDSVHEEPIEPPSPTNFSDLIQFSRPLSTFTLSRPSILASSNPKSVYKSKGLLRRLSDSVDWVASRKAMRKGRKSRSKDSPTESTSPRTPRSVWVRRSLTPRPNLWGTDMPTPTRRPDRSGPRARGPSPREHDAAGWRPFDQGSHTSPYLSASSPISPLTTHASRNPASKTHTEKQESGFSRQSFDRVRRSLHLSRR